jgi:hypothetical protein
MDSQDEYGDRLLELLEEVRLLMAGNPPAAIARPKQLSWDDVWSKAPYVKRNTTTSRQPTSGAARLSEQYTRAVRAIHFSSQ